MNKTRLIERIAEEAGVTEGEARGHLGAFGRAVAEVPKGGEEVGIAGFGKFSVRGRSWRGPDHAVRTPAVSSTTARRPVTLKKCAVRPTRRGWGL